MDTIKVIMHGCNGKMGQTISGLIAADEGIEIAAGIDAFDDGHNAYPVFTEASEKTAVLKSANMSLGINMLMKLLKEAAPVLSGAGFDIEIVEKHHNQKIDAPSGTALALADVIRDELDDGYDYVYDRSAKREKRSRKEIGISAVRGGTIVGDHDVLFAGADEVITFSHRAYSKAVFGKGAVQAAKFLAGKPAGLYDMSDVINTGKGSV